MAKRNFLVDLDMNNNQLLNVTIQNLATHPSTLGKIAGFIYWNTAEKTSYIYTGLANPNEWLDLGKMYTHNTQGVINPTLSGANVLASLSVNSEGHVTSATTRVLTLAELGYTGDVDANKYVHPTFASNGLAGAPLTGAVVISNVVVNAEGHVSGFSTRSLTPANIGASALGHTHTLSQGATDVTATAAELNLLDLAGMTTGWVLRATSATTAAWSQLKGSEILNDLAWVIVNDSVTNSTNTWSSTKIQSELSAINNTITGGLVNKGGYDANTNSPLLDATPIAGIKNGWVYTVTANGNFFTESVQIGDMLIAKQDSPTTLAHWTVVNKNIADIVQASASAQGIIQLATSAEVIAGTDSNKAITPATLQTKVATETAIGLVAAATQAEVTAGTLDTKFVSPLKLKTTLDARVGGYALSFGNGVLTNFDFTHGLNTVDVAVQIIEVSSGETVEMQVRRTSATVVNVQCNVAPTSNQFRIIIKK